MPGASKMSVLEEDHLLEIANDSGLKSMSETSNLPKFWIKIKGGYPETDPPPHWSVKLCLAWNRSAVKKKVGGRCCTRCEWTQLKVLTQLTTTFLRDVIYYQWKVPEEERHDFAVKRNREALSAELELWEGYLKKVTPENCRKLNLQAHESKEAVG